MSDGRNLCGRLCYQLPMFSMDCQGSASGKASLVCRSSIETLSGDFIKAILPSRGGRLIVTPASIKHWQVS